MNRGRRGDGVRWVVRRRSHLDRSAVGRIRLANGRSLRPRRIHHQEDRNLQDDDELAW